MDPSNQGHALVGPDGHALLLPGLYQPTFLYEVIWDLGTALVVLLADRKYKLGKGRAFALYVMVYTVGRAWIEYLRIDDANHILGLRLNDWTAIIVFIGALIYFLRVKGPREYLVPDTDNSYRVVTEEEALKINDADGTDSVYAPKSETAAVADGGAEDDRDSVDKPTPTGSTDPDPVPTESDPDLDTADRDAADEPHSATK
jgi:hypothetical protein